MTENDREERSLERRLARKVQQLEAVVELGRVLAGVAGPREVASRLGLTVAGQFLVRRWAVLAAREGREPLVETRGLGAAAEALGASAAEVCAGFRGRLEPILLEGAVRGPVADPETGGSSNDAIACLRDAGLVAAVPLLSGETPCGVLALGPRLGGRSLEEGDLELAKGLATQAVIAFEAAWQGEEADRWKAETEARAEWSRLDRICRLAFVAISRLGFEQAVDLETVAARLGELLGLDRPRATVDSAVSRLTEAGLVVRDPDGRLHVDRPELLGLAEVRQPLEELARSTAERVGAYRILGPLGRGGMGQVLRAESLQDGSPAAVKILPLEHFGDRDAQRRFERECELVSRLRHPNIVRILSRGEDSGRLFLAMELIEGRTVEERIAERGYARSEAVRALADLAAALEALHGAGVVHRDVKSGNVMRTPAGRHVLLDFGLARSADSLTLTSNRDIVGTLPFMAPEQLRGETVTPAADVWAAGILLLHMLDGRLPWRRPENVGLVTEILDAGPELARGRGLPEEVEDVLLGMLARDPSDRWKDGGDLRTALARLDVGELAGPAVALGVLETADTRLLDGGLPTRGPSGGGGGVVEPTRPAGNPADRISPVAAGYDRTQRLDTAVRPGGRDSGGEEE